MRALSKRIAVIILALSVILSATGCSAAGKPTEAFDKLMAAFIETDGEKMLEYINDSTYSPFITYMELPTELTNLLVDKLVLTKYVVKSETLSKDKKSAELEIEFTYYDTGTRMAEAHLYTLEETQNGSMKDADFDKSQAFIAETFTKYLTEDVPTVTETHKINFAKDGAGHWKYQPITDPETVDPLYNIFSGNIFAYISALGYTSEE